MIFNLPMLYQQETRFYLSSAIMMPLFFSTKLVCLLVNIVPTVVEFYFKELVYYKNIGIKYKVLFENGKKVSLLCVDLLHYYK